MPTDANALIGTRSPAPRQREMLQESRQSYDYAAGIPYPEHAFNGAQWPAIKGPRPTALPYAQILVTEGAEFLFRNGNPTFSVADDDRADEFLQDVIAKNALSGQWIPHAIAAGHQGAVAVKFSYDAGAEVPVRIVFLDVPQECRVWIDPHDLTRILMARIQYPYRDLETGDWFFYREEWTDDLYVTYAPLYAGASTVTAPTLLPAYREHLGDLGDWQERDREPNPFGLIPVSVIRNRAVKGNPLGEGDCWRTFRLMDRIALTLHGEDYANQFHSQPATVYKNARPDVEGPALPGEPIVVVNEDPQGAPADVALLEPSGAAREFSHRTIDKWEELLYQAVGLSRVNPESVTNKGSMTVQAFLMTYQRTIATSDRKRELWGNSGFAPFFKKLLLGLANLGGVPEVSGFSEEMTVGVTWPAYFEQTQEDIANTTSRTIDQMQNNLLTPERAAERVAVAEKMPKSEVEALKGELKVHGANQRRRETMLTKIRYTGGVRTQEEAADFVDTSGTNNFTA